MRLIALLLLLWCTETVSAQPADSLLVNIAWTSNASLDSVDQFFIDRTQALLAKGDTGGALIQYQLWINRLLPEFDDEDMTSNPDESDLYYSPPSLVNALLGKAKLLEQIANPKDRSGVSLEPALTCRELIVDALFHLRQNEDGTALSYERLQAHRQQEWDAINLAYLLYEKSNNPSYLLRCFRLVEKSKKAALANTLIHPSSYQLANIPPEYLAQLTKHKREVGHLSTIWVNTIFNTNNKNANAINQAKDNFIKARKAYNRKLIEFSKSFPKVYGFWYNESVVTVGEIQKRLTNKGRVLLSYYQTSDYLYGFVLTLNGLKAKRLELPSDLNAQIERFHALLKNKEEQQNCMEYNELAFKLYSSLIQPFEPLSEEVVIIPDGLIGYVPFNALLNQNAGTSCAFESHPFLIHQYQISLHYSAEAFAKDAYANNRKANDRVELLAPSNNTYAKRLSREVGAHFVPVESLTPEIVLTKIPSSSMVLIANPLTSRENEEDPLDNLLWADHKPSDVSDNHIATELVTLSNCDVQISSMALLRGNISVLGRSFFHHGAECVLGTLWRIPDQENEALLSSFFHSLKKGKNKSLSLHLSNQSYLAQTQRIAAPSQWAAYTLIGNTDAIVEKNIFWWILLILPLGLLWYQWRKRKKERLRKEREVTTTMEY